MNRKTISIVLGALLIGSFFLPYFSWAGILKMSGFEIISKGDVGAGIEDADKYLMLLTPLAGILLLIGALNKDRYIPSRPLLGLIGLLGVLYPLIRLIIESKGDGMGQVIKIMGLGFWLGLAAAIAVLVYNPKS